MNNNKPVILVIANDSAVDKLRLIGKIQESLPGACFMDPGSESEAVETHKGFGLLEAKTFVIDKLPTRLENLTPIVPWFKESPWTCGHNASRSRNGKRKRNPNRWR